MTTFLYALLAFAIGVVLGRARYTLGYQNRGEARVCQALRASFSAPDYHLFNHVTLKFKDGTTQVDHVLVSRFGVFVIETKDYTGWIFANAKQANWTQVIYRGKFRFQNPIFQNMLHVRAVRDLLDFLPPEAVKSVVVFAGDAEFKTEMPAGVFTLSGLIDHVRGSQDEIMSANRMQFCVGRLETARLAVSGKTDIEHVESLERRYGRSD